VLNLKYYSWFHRLFNLWEVGEILADFWGSFKMHVLKREAGNAVLIACLF
jgi:hypothetical protein